MRPDYLEELYSRLDELERGYQNLAHLVKLLYERLQEDRANLGPEDLDQKIKDLLK